MFGQGLDVFELKAAALYAVRRVIEDLQRGDFVFVLLDELLECWTICLARSSASALKPASMTLSWLTLSMVCSSLFLSSIRRFGALDRRGA